MPSFTINQTVPQTLSVSWRYHNKPDLTIKPLLSFISYSSRALLCNNQSQRSSPSSDSIKIHNTPAPQPVLLATFNIVIIMQRFFNSVLDGNNQRAISCGLCSGFYASLSVFTPHIDGRNHQRKLRKANENTSYGVLSLEEAERILLTWEQERRRNTEYQALTALKSFFVISELRTLLREGLFLTLHAAATGELREGLWLLYYNTVTEDLPEGLITLEGFKKVVKPTSNPSSWLSTPEEIQNSLTGNNNYLHCKH